MENLSKIKQHDDFISQHVTAQTRHH